MQDFSKIFSPGPLVICTLHIHLAYPFIGGNGIRNSQNSLQMCLYYCYCVLLKGLQVNHYAINDRCSPKSMKYFSQVINVMFSLQTLSACMTESQVSSIINLLNCEFRKAYLDNLGECSVLNEICYLFSGFFFLLMICRHLRGSVVV